MEKQYPKETGVAKGCCSKCGTEIVLKISLWDYKPKEKVEGEVKE